MFFLLFSCHDKQETIAPPVPPDPWEYINRISDTLPETEFSLFNDKQKNMELFMDSTKNSYWVKYRIGQNKYLPVYLSNLNVDPGIVACYFGDFFDIEIKENGDYYVLDSIANIFESNISTIFKKFLKEKFNHSENTRRWPLFSVSLVNHQNQEILSKTIDQIVIGYLDYLNDLATLKYNIEFKNLNKYEQNILIRTYPIILDYNVDRLFPKPPPILPSP